MRRSAGTTNRQPDPEGQHLTEMPSLSPSEKYPVRLVPGWGPVTAADEPGTHVRIRLVPVAGVRVGDDRHGGQQTKAPARYHPAAEIFVRRTDIARMLRRASEEEAFIDQILDCLLRLYVAAAGGGPQRGSGR